MSHLPKQSRNEKWKALRADALAQLDLLVEQALDNRPATLADLIRSQIILIDLLEALLEPTEPE